MTIKIGANIQTQRVAAGLSQTQLAAQLHVTRQTISKWELDKSYPDLDTLVALSQVLATDIRLLLGLDIHPAPKQSWWHWLRWNASEKIVPWYAGGAPRAKVAVAMLSQLLTSVPATQPELRAILADHYQQFMAETTSVPYILESLELQVAGCLHRTHYQFNAADSERFAQLLALSHIRGRIV